MMILVGAILSFFFCIPLLLPVVGLQLLLARFTRGRLRRWRRRLLTAVPTILACGFLLYPIASPVAPPEAMRRFFAPLPPHTRATAYRSWFGLTGVGHAGQFETTPEDFEILLGQRPYVVAEQDPGRTEEMYRHFYQLTPLRLQHPVVYQHQEPFGACHVLVINRSRTCGYWSYHND